MKYFYFWCIAYTFFSTTFQLCGSDDRQKRAYDCGHYDSDEHRNSSPKHAKFYEQHHDYQLPKNSSESNLGQQRPYGCPHDSDERKP